MKSADLAGMLAVAGRDGTLARRFVGTPVAGRLRAKTGSLDGVAALGGYVDNRSGTTLAFAYVVNGLTHGSSASSLQDALAAALVSIAPSPILPNAWVSNVRSEEQTSELQSLMRISY